MDPAPSLPHAANAAASARESTSASRAMKIFKSMFPPPGAGLIPDFNALRGPGFNPDAIHPAIRHFYEHAAAYQLEVWTEVALLGRFFLWLLVEFISRRMDQLNFPISSLEVAKGMSSEVVQLVEPASGRIVNTGWLRRLKSSWREIYSGLDSATQMS